MTEVMDAPWIREAELFGPDEPEDFNCPICGEENPEDFYIDKDGELLGCSACVKRVDAYDYYVRHLKES